MKNLDLDPDPGSVNMFFATLDVVKPPVFGNRCVPLLPAVFRIRDILRRIRILGSIHWITYPDLDPDPAIS